MPIFAIPFTLFLLQVGGTPLHILLIVIDDFGWSDVVFHDAKIHTPDMDTLGCEGVILDNYYVQRRLFSDKKCSFDWQVPYIHTGLFVKSLD